MVRAAAAATAGGGSGADSGTGGMGVSSVHARLPALSTRQSATKQPLTPAAASAVASLPPALGSAAAPELPPPPSPALPPPAAAVASSGVAPARPPKTKTCQSGTAATDTPAAFQRSGPARAAGSALQASVAASKA